MGSERYLISGMRYIELNPVRAVMVAHPQSYPWSSWHANIGKRQSGLVTPHPEYVALGLTAAEHQENYRALVLQDEQERVTTQLRNTTHFWFVSIRPPN
ncbi:hypothetical protein D7243_03860 [Stutzerimonas stutzeri]|nr:hypothetical protein [Stutzerimonas stutzeri]